MADSTRRENRADQTLGEMLNERGVSRRSFLKFASYTASILALPPTAGPVTERKSPNDPPGGPV